MMPESVSENAVGGLARAWDDPRALCAGQSWFKPCREGDRCFHFDSTPTLQKRTRRTGLQARLSLWKMFILLMFADFTFREICE